MSLTLSTPIGTRVRIAAPIEIFPIDIFQTGLTGVLVEVDPTARDVVAMVRLDQHHDGLAEWDNRLQVWRDDSDESCCTLRMFEMLP